MYFAVSVYSGYVFLFVMIFAPKYLKVSSTFFNIMYTIMNVYRFMWSNVHKQYKF